MENTEIENLHDDGEGAKLNTSENEGENANDSKANSSANNRADTKTDTSTNTGANASSGTNKTTNANSPLKPHIILASASPRRRELLEAAGIKAQVRESMADETLPPEIASQPREAVKHLAQRKVEAVVGGLLTEIDASFQRSALQNYASGAGPIVTRDDENEGYAKLPALVIGADTMVVLNCETYGKPHNEAEAKKMLGKLSGNTHTVMTGVSMWLITADSDTSADTSDAPANAPAKPSNVAKFPTDKTNTSVDAPANENAEATADALDSAKADAPQPFTPSINVGVISFVDESEVTFNKLTEEQIDEYVATGECFDKAGAYAAQGKGAALIQQIDGNLDTVIGLPVKRMIKDYASVLGVGASEEK